MLNMDHLLGCCGVEEIFGFPIKVTEVRGMLHNTDHKNIKDWCKAEVNRQLNKNTAPAFYIVNLIDWQNKQFATILKSFGFELMATGVNGNHSDHKIYTYMLNRKKKKNVKKVEVYDEW